ncbi:unnamed protein product [Cladocopium goreaui]|uniref:EF-hand domain-containing protein n=1 Tax=Cladocopium goreaui TaxID=2562237 RepID=A0A9P1FQE7_9DINO|nr:unnamed protein product [Cladocopium goreaui]
MAGKTPRMSRHGATSASASAASVVNTVVSAPSGRRVQRENLGPATATGERMTLSSASELQVAFELLDEQKRGALDHQQAKRWLRCAGWCLPDQELSAMLQEHAKQRSKRGAAPEEKWVFKQLLDLLEKNRSRENTTLKRLQTALRILAKNRSKIAKEKLLEISDAELVLQELKLESKTRLDCDALAEKVLARVYDPSCPSWAGPSVLICVQREQAPDVHIKYASHAHLDLLFDTYCRRIQVDSSRVSFKLRNRMLQEDDTYESLRMGSQDTITAIVDPNVRATKSAVRFEADSASENESL